MKKFHLFFTLLLLLFFFSSFGRKKTENPKYSLSQQADSSVYGIIYDYDASGNRISRSPNTIITSSHSSFEKYSPQLDSLWNNHLSTNIRPGDGL